MIEILRSEDTQVMGEEMIEILRSEDTQVMGGER